MNLIGDFVVRPTVTGNTPKPSESEWPDQFSSLMMIDMAEWSSGSRRGVP